jgi:hypothetical protein
METNKEKSPDHIKLWIYGAPRTLASDLKNIADHKGIARNQFLKSELHKIRDSYPEHMRKPFNKDGD